MTISQFFFSRRINFKFVVFFAFWPSLLMHSSQTIAFSLPFCWLIIACEMLPLLFFRWVTCPPSNVQVFGWLCVNKTLAYRCHGCAGTQTVLAFIKTELNEQRYPQTFYYSLSPYHDCYYWIFFPSTKEKIFTCLALKRMTSLNDLHFRFVAPVASKSNKRNNKKMRVSLRHVSNYFHNIRHFFSNLNVCENIYFRKILPVATDSSFSFSFIFFFNATI